MKKKIVAWFLLFAMMIALLPTGSVQAATYKNGSKGTQVRNLQRNLAFLGYSVGTIDGSFGNNTKKAVICLQEDLYLEQTGVVEQSLNNLIKGTVRDIQSYLKEKGYYTGTVDGIVGTGTTNSIKKYQKAKGYSQTGVVSDLILWDMVNDTTVKTEMNDLTYWVLRTRNGGNGNRDKEYLSLFRQYPFCLNNEMFENTLGNYVSVADDVLKKNDKDTVFGAILTGLSEGKDIIWNELIAKFNNSTKTYKEQMRLDAISCLMRDVCENENLLTVVAEEVGDKIGTLKSGYNWNKKQDREALAKEVSGITAGLSIDEVEKIFELIDEDETVKEAFDNLDTGIKITEYAVGVIQLYQIEVTTLERLQDLLPEDSDMYKDLEFLKQERSRNEVQYILETIMASEVKDMLLDALESQLLPFPASVIMTGAELSISIFANHIYTGALSEDLIQTYLLRSYVNTLKSAVLDMNTNFMMAVNQNKKLPTVEQMEDYEFVYTAYLAAVKNYLICAENIADKYSAPLISAGLKEYDTLFTYQNYTKLCLKQLEEYRTSTVTNRMDYLLDKLGVGNNHEVYFTVNQNECLASRKSPHGCKNCNMRDIANSNWFINLFGKVNVDNFPEHDVNASRRDHTGQSCFGFACFAQWYIYADALTDKVESERVATVKFNKANMQKYVQPGDVVRVNGHSILVYSVEEKGLMVIDSNWNLSGQLNCVVQKHLIPYTNEYCAGHTAYINRVKTSENEVINTNEKTQYGYYHYTNGEGKYSVCAHYGKETSKWDKVYYEEVWLDEPLTLTSSSASGYRHVEVNGCKDIGCVDGFWSAGGKYEDASGVVWYRQKTRVVPKDTEEEKSSKFIWEKEQLPQITQAPIQDSSEQEVSTSGWVKASECPADAQIIETKWTYTYTEQKESSSTSMEGWINSGERKEVVASGSFEYASFPETFDTKNAIYKEIYSSKDAVPVAAGAQREILSDNMTGYVYWHYTYPVADKSVGNRIVGYYYNQHLKKEVGNWCYTTSFAAIKTAKNYTTTATGKSGGGKIYKITDKEFLKYDVAKGSYWWYRFEYNTCTYQDVKTVYQYYKTSEKESFTEIKEGNGISNVVKWVRYMQ